MSNYLLNLQRALAETDVIEAPSMDYAEGWVECGCDLAYGVQCGSEHAVKSQMAPWLLGEDSPYYEELDSESDKGYCDRIKVIQLLMEKQNES